MTKKAIKTIEHEKKNETALNLNANDIVPFHPENISVDSLPENGDQLPADDSSAVTLAQSRFVSAVTSAIAILNYRYGYSKDNATNLILKEIRQGDSIPDNEEIFQVMLSTGLGISDATKVLTVSKALQKARTERHGSLLQAINYLTSQMRISRLLGKNDSSEMTEFNSSVLENDSELLTGGEHILHNNVKPKKSYDEESPAQSKLHVPRIPTSISRKNQVLKNFQKSGKQKTVTRPPLQLKANRKRQLSGADVAARASLKPLETVPKIDDTIHNMDAEVVKKTILAKDQSAGWDDPALRSKSSASPVSRTKLTSSQREDNTTVQTKHSPLKRSHADTV